MVYVKYIIAGYLLFINLLAFILYFADKQKAKKKQWRIREATLLGVAWLGGALGAFLGMQIFRHKTKHIRFVLLVPLALLVWIALIGVGIFFYRNGGKDKKSVSSDRGKMYCQTARAVPSFVLTVSKE